VEVEDRGKIHDRQYVIRERSGDHNRRSLEHRLKMKTQRPFAGIHCLQARGIGSTPGIFIAEKLHVAAERNGRDLPARAIAIVKTGKLRAKADGKCQDLHAAQARHQKVAELMEKYDQAEDE